jgi:hypothetical protein
MSTIKIHNVETGEILERELTTKELEQLAIEQAAFKAKQAADEAEAEAKATQKAALLERLGITEDEAKLLLG